MAAIAINDPGKATRKVVKTFAASDDFAEMVQAVELIDAGTQLYTRGRQYDLEDIFNRVNLEYYEGSLARPQLTWNQTLSKYKFGHYQPSSDTLMISITLDDPKVPEYVIDFVMFHELLHKALGVKVINGRRYAHTREFRKKEKHFGRYEEAQEVLRKLASE